MIRVFAAIDHPAIRGGITRLLINQPEIEVSGVSPLDDSILAAVRSCDCSMLLLGVFTASPICLDTLVTLLTALRHEFLAKPILIITNPGESEYARPLLEIGASGYISLDGVLTELIGAIRTLAGGGKYVSGGRTMQLGSKMERALASGKRPFDTLTPQELVMLRSLARGFTYRETAQENYLGEGTVRNYVANIYEKLNLRDGDEAIHYAVIHALELFKD